MQEIPLAKELDMFQMRSLMRHLNHNILFRKVGWLTVSCAGCTLTYKPPRVLLSFADPNYDPKFITMYSCLEDASNKINNYPGLFRRLFRHILVFDEMFDKGEVWRIKHSCQEPIGISLEWLSKCAVLQNGLIEDTVPPQVV
jgi:hypothetical protein